MPTAVHNKLMFNVFTLLLCCIFCQANLMAQNNKDAIPSTNVTKIVAKGNLEIIIFQNEEEDLYIHAPTNLSRNIKSEFIDGIFTITNTNQNSAPVKIMLVVKDLTYIKATGKVTINTPTNVNFSKLNITLAEESIANLFISSADMLLEVHGNGNLNVSGEIDTLRLKSDGNAESTFDIKSKKIYANLKNESEAMIDGDVFSLIAVLENYSTLDNTESVTGTCNITTNNSSMAKVKAEDKFILLAKDRSSIIYKGTGKAETTNKDKGATLKPELKKEKSLSSKK